MLTSGDTLVFVDNVVLPLLEPSAVYATGQSMKTNRTKVPLGSLSS